MLKINACQKLEELEIDSPNLSSFVFCSFENSIRMIFSKNPPCPFELTFTVLFNDTIWFSFWFLQLSELLAMSNQRKVLNLTITIWEEVCLLMQLSSFQLEVMMIDVRCSTLSMDYRSLVEGLLSSFRPKKLLLPNRLGFPEEVNKGMIFLLLDFRVPLLD